MRLTLALPVFMATASLAISFEDAKKDLKALEARGCKVEGEIWKGVVLFLN
jgi:hypothetical protein